MIIPNMWKNKTCSKPPIRILYQAFNIHIYTPPFNEYHIIIKIYKQVSKKYNNFVEDYLQSIANQNLHAKSARLFHRLRCLISGGYK
jgi:hypothetical protein